jgi:hypothetical protein
LTSSNIFGWPVVRYGKICGKIIPLTFEQADSVAKLLKSRFLNLKKELPKKLESFGLESASFLDGECDIQYWEGPVVKYPELHFIHNGIPNSASVAVTVCRTPRHSKIWVRISYGNPRYQNHYKLSYNETETLFELISSACAHVAGFMLSEYQQALEKVVNIKIEEIHTLKIFTCAADLGKAAQDLEDETFVVKDVLGNEAQYGALPQLIEMAYGEKIASLEQYEKNHETYQWIAMTMHEKQSLVGLYAKHHYDQTTNFTGLVHSTSNEASTMSQPSRDFSRRLLRDIAPMI